MKSFFRYLGFAVKEILFYMFGVFIALYIFGSLKTKTSLPFLAVSIIVLIILAFVIWIGMVVFNNCSKHICKHDTYAKLIDSVTDITDDGEGPPGLTVFRNKVRFVEYEYKGRKYKASVKTGGWPLKKYRGKIKIRVCEFCPRIIYIVQDETV